MSKKQMRENIFRRVPKLAHPLVEVALQNYPRLVDNINLIVATHSCRSEQVYNLMDHLTALIAAESVSGDPMRAANLRMMAYKPGYVDEKPGKCFETGIIDKVKKCGDGWDLHMKDSWSFWADSAPDGYEPQVGSIVWQFTIGTHILGIVIDGHVFRYQTLAQYRAESEARVERWRAEERERFPEHDKRIAALPEIFQQRIRKFQRAPYFREDLEAYEIFVCEQAMLIANRWKTADKLKRWCSLNWKHRGQLMPELYEAGHSGNTMGFSIILARFYLEDPEKILRIYGAMSPLVGSDAYLPLEERKNAA